MLAMHSDARFGVLDAWELSAGEDAHPQARHSGCVFGHQHDLEVPVRVRVRPEKLCRRCLCCTLRSGKRSSVSQPCTTDSIENTENMHRLLDGR